jgi:WD40 repeat protein
LIVIPSLKVVVTGSSDRDIRIWDLTSLEGRDLSSIINATSELIEETTILDISSPSTSLLPPIVVPSGAAPPLAKSKDPLPVLITLKAHIRPPERLGFYRITNSASKDEENEDSIKSDTGRVALVSADSLGFVIIWEVWKDEMTGELKSELKSNVKLHENGIYDLVICENELWTGKNSLSSY